MNKALKILKKTATVLAILALTIFLIVQIAILGSVYWLNSEDGQSFVDQQLALISQNSDYTLEIADISYSFPQGLKIDNATISHKAQKISEIGDLVIRPGYRSLLVKHLAASISAKSVTVYALPETQSTEPSAPLQPFTLPDLFFTHASLNDLSIDTLYLKEEVIGMKLLLGLRFGASVSLGERIKARSILKLKDLSEEPALWMPQKIAMSGAFDPSDLTADLKTFSIKNTLYDLRTQGSADLAENGAITLNISGGASDLSMVSEEMDGALNADFTVSGTLNTLTAAGQATLKSSMLDKQGLGDVRLTINDAALSAPISANIAIDTTYQSEAARLSTTISQDGDVIAARALNIEAANAALNGDIIATLIKGEDKTGLKIDADFSNLRYDTISTGATALDVSFDDTAIMQPQNASLSINALNIQGAQTIDRIVLSLKELAGTKTHDLNLSTSISQPQKLSLNGSAKLHDIYAQSPAAKDINLRAATGSSSVSLTGSADQNALNLSLKTNTFKLGSIKLITLREQLAQSTISGETTITGSPAAPIINADMSLNSISPLKNTSANISMIGRYADGKADLTLQGRGTGIKTLTGQATLPMKLSFMPWIMDIKDTSPIKGALNANLDIATLAPLFLPVSMQINGGLRADASIDGTLKSPDIQGNTSIQNGSFLEKSYGLTLQDLNVNADFNTAQISITRLSAKGADDQGTLTGRGNYNFTNPADTSLNIAAKEMHLLKSNKANGVFDADLRLDGKTDGYKMSGSLTSREIDIHIPERFTRTIPSLNVVENANAEDKSALETIDLDLKVIAENRVFVRGWGLDAEFGGALDIDGTAANPNIIGTLEARRGRYEEFGRRFTLDKANLRFQGIIPPSPYLDITAVTNIDGTQANINLSGSATAPDISLSSSPALPEDEVMARILFGRDMSKITPFQAVQLKQSLDRLSGNGGGGFDPLGTLKNLTGLDDIRVDTEGESTSAGVGKYLTDSVYIELEKGTEEGSGAANVEIELTPNVTIESTVGEDAKAGGGVLWHWDY